MKVNILISSAGRRIGLMRCFRDSMTRLGVDGRIIAVDATPYSAAGQLADQFYLVPKCTESGFIQEVLNICRQEQVHLIVPTIDTELWAYAGARESFLQNGVTVAISCANTVAICSDKIRTHEWLTEHGLPVPRQASVQAVLERRNEWSLPLIVKPVAGSGSAGLRAVKSFKELAALELEADELIVQERIDGMEYTVNVFVNHQRRCICAVPHARLEVRGGEVSKGITVKHRDLMLLVEILVEMLPNPYGALNVQCFRTSCDELKVIEINARFGGGYPLTHRAGARIAQWLIEDVMGRGPCQRFEDWQDGLVMLRYDEAVYVSKASLERCHSHAAADGLNGFGILRRAMPVKLIPAHSSEWEDHLERTSHDFFHTAKYHQVTERFNGGRALMAVCGNGEKFIAWPMIMQDLRTLNLTNANGFHDLTSVYGYTGPIAHGCENDQSFLRVAWESITDLWRSHQVVSAFTRFHPLMRNYNYVPRLRDERNHSEFVHDEYAEGATIAVDLRESQEAAWQCYSRHLHQTLRRLIRQGVTVSPDPEWAYLDEFARMYHSTMRRNCAGEFYFFSHAYFAGLKEALGPHGSLMIARCGDEIAAASLLIEYGGMVHVHLLATDDKFLPLSPSKLLIHEAQGWARARGNQFLHLGGGRGSRMDDPLFRFKSQFSDKTYPFYTGRWILNGNVYDALAAQRSQPMPPAPAPDGAERFFPAYRAPI